MKQTLKDLKLPLLLIFLMTLCAAIALPVTPIDETRYVSAAWEMWTNHSFLVPLLNGLPYSHKPPFLFWMMHVSWLIFGVSDFTPRLIPGVFSLLNLILVYRIGLRLWPQDRKTAAYAALILATIGIWDAWSVAIMFDMVLTFWILLGLLGTLRAADGRKDGWLLLAAGVGGGILTKGPAVFVYLLSIPLLRILWNRPVPKRWILCVLGVALLGLAISLVWVIPAAIDGGEQYRHMILWGQTADRLTSSFAHRRPFWWYLPILPAFFFPWILFRPVFRRIRWKEMDMGTRFCLTWLTVPLLIFSAISGKQVHYLIPFIPAGALLFGRNIAQAHEIFGKISLKILGGIFLLAGLAALFLPMIDMGGDIGRMEYGDTRFAAIGFLLASGYLFMPLRNSGSAVRRIALSMALVLLCALIEDKKYFMDDYDMKDTAVFIKEKMDEGCSVAHIGKYHGQYQFLGRLTEPLTVVENNPVEIRDFKKSHPHALFVSYLRRGDPVPEGATVCFSHEYRGKTVVVLQFPEQMR